MKTSMVGVILKMYKKQDRINSIRMEINIINIIITVPTIEKKGVKMTKI